MSAPQTEKWPSIGDLLRIGAFFVGLISAWLYSAGWTYAYHYFDRFGIPLLMVDIPKENYFIYGGVVARNFPIWAIAIGLVGVAVGYFWSWLDAKLDHLLRLFSSRYSGSAIRPG
jgi:hypothetical protein